MEYQDEDNEKSMAQSRMNRWRTLVTLSPVGCCLLAVGLWLSGKRERFDAPERTGNDRVWIDAKSLFRRPESRNSSIALYLDQAGQGYEVEWDTFGRKGWYTQDPRLKPVDPTSVFRRMPRRCTSCSNRLPWEDPHNSAHSGFWKGRRHPARQAVRGGYSGVARL